MPCSTRFSRSPEVTGKRPPGGGVAGLKTVKGIFLAKILRNRVISARKKYLKSRGYGTNNF